MLDDIEKDLENADIDKFLAEALASGNYKLAVRLYFLKTLQLLTKENLIRWEKDKTDREYLREMSSSPHGKTFRQLTHIFEATWYGDIAPESDDFVGIETRFKDFLNAVENKNTGAA